MLTYIISILNMIYIDIVEAISAHRLLTIVLITNSFIQLVTNSDLPVYDLSNTV